MQNALPFLAFFGFTALIVGLAVVLGRAQAKRAARNLTALAEELGLQLDAKPPVFFGMVPQLPGVRGTRGGRGVRFFEFSTGSGKHRQRWCAFGVSCENRHGLTFRLSTQSVFSKLGEMFGMQDVQVGHPAFDEKFVVKTNAPDYLRAALVPELREPLLRLWSPTGFGAHLKLEGGEVVYAELGQFSESKQLDRMKTLLDPVLELAVLAEVYRG